MHNLTRRRFFRDNGDRLLFKIDLVALWSYDPFLAMQYHIVDSRQARALCDRPSTDFRRIFSMTSEAKTGQPPVVHYSITNQSTWSSCSRGSGWGEERGGRRTQKFRTKYLDSAITRTMANIIHLVNILKKQVNNLNMLIKRGQVSGHLYEYFVIWYPGTRVKIDGRFYVTVTRFIVLWYTVLCRLIDNLLMKYRRNSGWKAKS